MSPLPQNLHNQQHPPTTYIPNKPFWSDMEWNPQQMMSDDALLLSSAFSNSGIPEGSNNNPLHDGYSNHHNHPHHQEYVEDDDDMVSLLADNVQPQIIYSQHQSSKKPAFSFKSPSALNHVNNYVRTQFYHFITGNLEAMDEVAIEKYMRLLKIGPGDMDTMVALARLDFPPPPPIPSSVNNAVVSKAAPPVAAQSPLNYSKALTSEPFLSASACAKKPVPTTTTNEADEDFIPVKAINVNEPRLCVYYMQGKCRYGSSCRMVHGNQCHNCNKNVLHPKDPAQNRAHLDHCLKSTKHQNSLAYNGKKKATLVTTTKDAVNEEKVPPALKVQSSGVSSEEAVCCLCSRIVKERIGDKRFGLLECEHVFCFPCIMKRRRPSFVLSKTSTNSLADFIPASLLKNPVSIDAPDNEPLNDPTNGGGVECPECHKPAAFITPSLEWPIDATRRQQIIAFQRMRLKSMPCHFWSREGEKCPFGEQCYYGHGAGKTYSLANKHGDKPTSSEEVCAIASENMENN